MAGDQGRGISQSTREPRGRRDKQGAAMSMAEASSSSNELLADDAERVAAGLRIQALAIAPTFNAFSPASINRHSGIASAL